MENQYWSGFYGSKTPDGHSAFAADCHEEFEILPLVDLGCGDGRDSHFFSSLGHRVLGLDFSVEALKVATSRDPELGAKYRSFDLENREASQGLIKVALNHRNSKPESDSMNVYGRFLLHAITKDAQDSIFLALPEILGPFGVASFEFRNSFDSF